MPRVVSHTATLPSSEKIVLFVRRDANADSFFHFCPADNLGWGQWSWKDITVGAVRSGEVHPRLLLCYSGHWIHGMCFVPNVIYIGLSVQPNHNKSHAGSLG